ncbi:hypothetical protein Hypma_005627 [Hypsizygus marmoreus]|uniref:Uncharacterized protein n=1 Tax=Hypsizygus marmoreus TaxID=39966 RepID=A0A369JXK6_HYPMA|nr:hypothetical protein Hypma_005627 [Hypsizygus marmoreus]
MLRTVDDNPGRQDVPTLVPPGHHPFVENLVGDVEAQAIVLLAPGVAHRFQMQEPAVPRRLRVDVGTAPRQQAVMRQQADMHRQAAETLILLREGNQETNVSLLPL